MIRIISQPAFNVLSSVPHHGAWAPAHTPLLPVVRRAGGGGVCCHFSQLKFQLTFPSRAGPGRAGARPRPMALRLRLPRPGRAHNLSLKLKFRSESPRKGCFGKHIYRLRTPVTANDPELVHRPRAGPTPQRLTRSIPARGAAT
jgi:hypothetical protein